MTPEETKLLHEFLTQLVEAGAVPKDQEAEAQIQRAARAQPDALYLLVQRSLILQQALEVAQRRIAELERPASAGNQGGSSGSFLGGGGWGRSAGADARTGLAHEAAAFQASRDGGRTGVAPGRGDPRPSPQALARGMPGSRAGGFLGQAAAVAAGVAGGAFLFHGIGSLLGQQDDGGSASLTPGTTEPAGDTVAFDDRAGADDARPVDGDQVAADGGAGDDFGSDLGGDFGGDDGMI